MRKVIESPLEYYLHEGKALHAKNVDDYLKILTDHAQIDQSANAKTVLDYQAKCNEVNDLQKQIRKQKQIRGWSIAGIIIAFLAVVIVCASSDLMPALQAFFMATALIAGIVGIVVLCKKINRTIRKLSADAAEEQAAANTFLQTAYEQMQPLNSLFDDECALRLTEKTFPSLSFDAFFTNARLTQMQTEYGFLHGCGVDECTLETLSGELYARPFLFERRRSHYMGTKTYHGSLTISWTTRERDSKGNTYTRNHTQTLHASVTKSYPEYTTRTQLYYCHEALPALHFTRTHANADEISERKLEQKLRSGERKLRRLEEKSAEKGGSFTQVENTDFEIIFNALNRNDELDFREMFTMKAQDSMLKLLLTKEGYGDDFDFFKRGKVNVICSEHAQFKTLKVYANDYVSYDFKQAEKNFRAQNNEFFKSIYFDFAPLMLIPAYQTPFENNETHADGERTVFNHQEIAYRLTSALIPNDTATECIFETSVIEKLSDGERINVLAKGYAAYPRTDYVSVHGGDGRFHNVPVEWSEYLPTQRQTTLKLLDKKYAKNTPQKESICVSNAYAYLE